MPDIGNPRPAPAATLTSETSAADAKKVGSGRTQNDSNVEEGVTEGIDDGDTVRVGVVVVDRVTVAVTLGVIEGVRVPVGVTEAVAVGDAVIVMKRDTDGVGEVVGVFVEVCVSDDVGVALVVGVVVGVTEEVDVTEGVVLSVRERVPVFVGVCETEMLIVEEGVKFVENEGVGVGVLDLVPVLDRVTVTVGVADADRDPEADELGEHTASRVPEPHCVTKLVKEMQEPTPEVTHQPHSGNDAHSPHEVREPQAPEQNNPSILMLFKLVEGSGTELGLGCPEGNDNT